LIKVVRLLSVTSFLPLIPAISRYDTDLVEHVIYFSQGKWEWIGNLARRFPYLPDSTVLWQEILWDGNSNEIPDSRIPGTVAQNFQFLVKQNLPYTVEAHGYLASQIEDAMPDSGIMAPPELEQRVKNASHFLLPTGLFATFNGPNIQITPNLVLPPLA
jgi:hypothetical protein